MSNRTLALTDRLYEYMLRVSLRESELQQRLREETTRMPEAGMQITPEQGQFITLLTQLLAARRALEVGVYTGYSSLAIALALPEDGLLTACDTSQEWTNVARRYWQEAGVADRIDLRLAPALDTLNELLATGNSESYDLAFLDADKVNYGGYYKLILKLLRPGGLMIIDNAFWGGSVADDAITDEATLALREINLVIQADNQVTCSLLPLGDGVWLVFKRQQEQGKMS